MALLVAACGDGGQFDADTGARDATPSAEIAARATAFDTADLSGLDADSLYRLGRAAYGDAEYDAARVFLGRLLERARAESDPTGEARALIWLGLAAWRLGDPELAERREYEALDTERRHDLATLRPMTLNALALIHWDTGRFVAARDWLDSTFEAARVVDDAEYRAKATVNLGNVETQLGETEAARRHFEEGLALFRRTGDAESEARTLTNLAALEAAAGNPVAVERAREARRLARSTSDPVGEEAALGQLASIQAALGHSRAALATVDTALRMARRSGQRQAEAANLETAAGIYRELGDLPRALRLFDEASRIDDAVSLRLELASNEYRVAEIYAALGNLDDATGRAARAARLHRELEAPVGELADLLLLAELHELAGDPAAADEHLARARELDAELGLRSTRLDVALAAARIADRRGADGRVLSILASVNEDVSSAGYEPQAEAAHLRARALARSGALEEAAAAGRAAVGLVERVRGELPAGVLASIFVHSRAAIYADAVDVLLRLGQPEEAFALAAAAGARDLGRWRTVPASASSDADSAAAAGEEGLLRRINALAEQVRVQEQWSGDPAYVAELVDRLRDERQRYEELRALRPPRPGGGQGSALPDVSEIRAALAPGEGMVQYLVGDERAFVFLVRPAGVEARRLDVLPDVLVTRIRLARRLLESPDAGDPGPVLEQLQDELLGVLRTEDAGFPTSLSRLYVVPHGVLTYLPFAALRDRETGRWLAEETTLVDLPTSALLSGRERGRDRAASDSTSAWPEAVVLVPRPAELRASEAEARSVSQALGGRVRVLTGIDATEPVARAALVEGALVHVASHAELNAVNPLFSALELGERPDERGSAGTDDGRLEVHEVLDLPVRSPLVFLSGCETGFGSGWRSAYSSGEDFATLARGFLDAGASGVVATLWRIEDQGAARFAARFYAHLRMTGDPAAALTAAQRESMHDERFANPFYWAAYRFSGFATRRRANHAAPSVS